MALYEHVFLVRQDVSAQQVEAIADQYKAVIESNGGAVKKVENWGLRALAYRVKKNRKAHYVLFNLDAPHAAVAEMERQESLSEDILRTMTIRVDELEEGPSAMLQKRDRDERDGALVDEGDDELHPVAADDVKNRVAHAGGEEAVGRAENQAAEHADRVADVDAGSRGGDADEVGDAGQRGHQAGGAEHARFLFAGRRVSHNKNLSLRAMRP